MKILVRSGDSRSVRCRQRGIERLRQERRYLQGLLAVDRPPEAQASIPMRAAQPHVARQRHQCGWRD